MPDPHETLSVFAEVAVAIAGFSGVVIAFGRRSIGELTPLEARRLFNLFTFSGQVLVLSLLGISLLHVESIDVSILWRGGSAVMVVFGLPWLILDWRKIRRLNATERAQVYGYVIYPFTVLAAAVLLLQLANIIVLALAWPVFFGLLLQVLFAFQQFILLIRTAVRDG